MKMILFPQWVFLYWQECIFILKCIPPALLFSMGLPLFLGYTKYVDLTQLIEADWRIYASVN